jgi:VanZ family protein
MPSAPHLRQSTVPAHGFRLAWILAVAYLLMIVYATGQPFRGWRMPPPEVFHFLTAPWPRYVTLDDILLNIAGYVPAGFLLALALRSRLRTRTAVACAIVAGLLLSLAMEAMQMFLPGRIASNVDVLTNTLGAVIGALAAPLFSPSRRLGQRLANLRHAWFPRGAATDAGIVIVFLWLLTPLHPTAQLFATGDLRSTLELPVWFIHTPLLSMVAEAAVVCFNLIGLGLLLTSITRAPSQAALLLIIVAGAGVLVKAMGGIALKTTAPLSWITPGVLLGLLAGGLMLYLLAHLRMRARRVVGLVSFIAAIVAINMAPGNPYHMIPPRLLAGGASHFLNFSGFVRALSELWPFAAALYLLAMAARHSQDGYVEPLRAGHTA